MKSPIEKRSIVIAGHKTSVSLEGAFWNGLKQIASRRELTLSEMVAVIDARRVNGNLSSAIRLFVLDQLCGRIEAPNANTGRSQKTSQARSAGGNGA